MARQSKLEKDLIEGVRMALLAATPGFEHSFLAGWLRVNHPKVAEALGEINPMGERVEKRKQEMKHV